ncbi:MAG: Hpt domain-containing protein, partial [Ignavibacteriaceae bacterium]|nr:Hpt domain-containing protein [Ignavibacteriaceae bacterium]
MDTKDEEFLKRLQATFRVEAEEHIRELTSGLIELEKAPKTEKTSGLIEKIFREAHSLKGASRSVNMKDVESICQVLENIFGELKNERISLTAEQYDLIHKAIDNISKMISSTGTKIPKDNRELIKQLQSITEVVQSNKINEENTTAVKKTFEETAIAAPSESEIPAIAESSAEERHAQTETVRIPTAKLDPLFLQAEQLIQSKIASVQRTTEMKTLNTFIDSWKKESRKWDYRRSTDNGFQLKEIIDWNNERLNELEIQTTSLLHAVENDQRSLGRMIDDHLEAMKNILMLPVSTMVEGFPKFIRDLARSQGKEAELIVHGKEIEVDKRILEELKDPLIHLIRNCIDHGIKKHAGEEQLSEKSHGKVTLSFNATESRHLEIIISDNGVGVDLDKVRRAAIKADVLDKNSLENLNAQETLMLIFQSGVTTSQMITDISGRGLGLAIVREKVEKL